MAIPVSASITQLNAEVFLQEGYELSLDAIVPSIELTGSFSPTVSKTQFYIYSYSKTLLYENLNYNAEGSYLEPASGTTISNSSSSYNQFELNPTEDIYNQGYSSGNYYAVYNFIDYELGSELDQIDNSEDYNGHPYFLKEISGDRTELRIQNNFLTQNQIESYYNQFNNKINARQNADEFYVSFGDNRNFIGVNTQLEVPLSGSSSPTSILVKLYKPLPIDFQIDDELQIISKVGESQVFSVDFQPNLEFIDNLLQLKGPNYNVDIKDRVNNSTNYKNYYDLINTVSSQSYYQFNSLKDQKGVILRKNYGDWNQFVKYSSAEQRLNNFKDKLASIESSSAELLSLSTITGGTTGSIDYSSSYNATSDNINQIISKFDSYEYFLYYITGSESWPKFTSTYPYTNFSVTSSEALNWFGSVNENSAYYNTGKNQIYSASRYDNNNQDYLYYLIPPFITENSSNNQYIKFVNMIGQSFDEMYLYTEAIEQVRNTNSQLTGSVLPLGLADDVIESLGYETGGNNFNSAGFSPDQIGTFPATGSGLEYIKHYIDIASGSVINYYDQNQSTLGYVIALADPSFPYPINNSSQEIYKRIFHNMVSLVKRKGTVTGLRQLINIWGVPNTMLRISEFGGKNKDDENDYDLWMNRYSTAIRTYSGSLEKNTPTTLGIQASSSVLIPWLPLTSNYYDGNSPSADYFSVPDCIQFRFKNKKPIGTDQFFTSSLLVKPWFDGAGGNIPNRPGAFGIVLEYSGSNSGSFNGSSLPTDNQYGTIQLVISGSVSDGATEGTQTSGEHYFTSSKISLPFFNDGWWSVQLQRLTNLSASNEDNTLNEFELRVANNIYDGYDGNQIGFQGSASITMADGKISSSMNEAWNNTELNTAVTGIGKKALGLGGIAPADGDFGSGPNAVLSNDNIKDPMNVGGKFIGRAFVGQFQEFRYYRRALTGSQFNDFVLNPESIQGEAGKNTGAGSSYDLLSFRASLGNELEYNNAPVGMRHVYSATGNYNGIKNSFFAGQKTSGVDNGIGSIHPSIVNSTGILFTSSFIQYPDSSKPRGIVTSSFYTWNITAGPDDQYLTASWIEPVTELNYMDQPAAGLRNRIKNKIQVIDKNEYGTILSPFRSIQQEFEQSASYTEDINSLEVGFSFQNEINDDIISTFGHGVVSDAIADPRFISESSDRYPELTRIAEDYFKKYQGFNVNNDVEPNSPTTPIEKEFDYNRLIKFYESSLFKAIKNYVPARTSLSTGIIVKQHLLERNKTSATVGISIDTPIAKTPETGSNNGILTTDPNDKYFSTGFNSGIFQENLLITSSIEMYSLTGSAGGSVNKYNVITNEGRFYTSEGDNIILTDGAAAVPLFDDTDFVAIEEVGIFAAVDYQGKVYFEAEGTFISQVRLNMIFTGTPSSAVDVKLEVTSSKRGGIFETTYDGITVQDPPGLISDNYLKAFADERLYWNIAGTGATVEIQAFTFSFGDDVEFAKPEPSSSQQAWFYIDDFTGEYRVKDTQEEFYNGEYSGSNVPSLPTQYNPYRIFVDGNDLTPDEDGGPVQIDITQAEVNTDFRNRTATSFDVTGSSLSGFATQNITGSVFPFNNNFPLEVGATYNITFKADNIVNAGIVGIVIYFNPGIGSDVSFTNTAPGVGTVGLAGVFSGSFVYEGAEYDIYGIGASPTYAGIQPYFQNIVAGEQARLSELSVVKQRSIGFKHLQPNDGFTIIPSSSFLFQNSTYNPIINNISGSRPNERFLDMDFDPVTSGSNFTQGIPNNYTLLVSASQLGWESVATSNNLLELAEVPESNYTAKSSANLRYEGSKVTSADYNFRITEINLSESAEPSSIFSPLRLPSLAKKSEIRFLNGETGSWKGDSTSEYASAIENRPINFAHFKTSYENMEKFGTTTFEIDQLIQIPSENIQSTQTPIITSSQLTGNNQNLVSVASTFRPDRKLKAVYNQSTKQFRNLRTPLTPQNISITSPTLNFGTLTNKSNYIFTPAQEIASEWTNQKTNVTVALTQSFFAPSWVLESINYGKSAGEDDILFNIQGTKNGVLHASTANGVVTASVQPDPLYEDSGSLTMFITGSSPASEAGGYGLLYLNGSAIGADNLYQYNFGAGSSAVIEFDVEGPHLSLINTLNHNINQGNISLSSSTQTINFPPELGGGQNTDEDNTTAQWSPNESQQFPFPFCVSSRVLDTISTIFPSSTRLPEFPLKPDGTRGIENYFRYNYSQSALTEYTDKGLPVMIEKGDIIRVTYAYPSTIVIPATPTQPASFAPVNDPNDLTQLEYINQDFTVLGYEQAPPALKFHTAYPYDGVNNLGWVTGYFGTGTVGNLFYADVRNLQPEGFFSPQELKKKFDVMATNHQVVMGISNDSNITKFITASVESCEIITEWGKPSGSSTTIAPTGSIRVGFRGWGSNLPFNEPVLVGTHPELLRTSINTGVSGNITGSIGGYGNAPAVEPSPSKYPHLVLSSEDFRSLDAGYVFDTLRVTPDPSKLEKPIMKGLIQAATVVKRIDDDTKVIVNADFPKGKKGMLTPSGDGYLIPDDLTDTQRDNVQKIINVLKSQNSFTNPPDANETQDVS